MTDKTPALPEPPLDEQFDTQMEVERNPCGAWQAIQTLSAQLSEALDRADRAEAKLRSIFASDGNEEARWIEDSKLACPHCGGSGHKDDVRATTAESALATAEAERDAARDELSTWRSVFPDLAPASVTPTTETMLRQAHNEALEKAAEVARSCPDSHWGPWIADRIDALKKETPNADK